MAKSSKTTASQKTNLLALPPPPAVHEDDLAWLDHLECVGLALASESSEAMPTVAQWAAWQDWLAHLATRPAKQARLVMKALRDSAQMAYYASNSLACPNMPTPIAPSKEDRRFDDASWKVWPFNLFAQSFLMVEDWWDAATTDVRGVSKRDEEQVNFMTRQILDRFAPSNFPATNPEVIHKTTQRGGMNMVEGWRNMNDDVIRHFRREKPQGADDFRPGHELATTPGKVVLRNQLMELIQYSPSTPKVQAEPVLIVPAWIMKYYILDLTAQNSLVKYLVDQGHTVFIISWHNPDARDRDMGMEDYRRMGVMAALNAVSAIVPGQKVHMAGYCLGGTISAISAATMARDGDDRLASLTLLAAQTDFTEAGELMLFINESELARLEDEMSVRGYLDSRYMAGAFQLLRSNDLIWSRIVRQYMLGETSRLNDLMAWNADATRMPARMHGEYLRALFLENKLFNGHYQSDGRPVALSDIRAPIFAVGTTKDHVSPWRSVFKIHIPTDTEVTFVLTNGGHNAGVVSEPGHGGRVYQILARQDQDRYMDPDTWLKVAPRKEGSWWVDWSAWMKSKGQGKQVAPPPMGAPAKGYKPLCNAPGTYVLER
ncbi:MAG: alpha/beta fold hydrolase [Alphaproteobacteria bacterium]|nr:MAG: alpha/beta fold hydrolase [Alphaproteobacteria bacterium]